MIVGFNEKLEEKLGLFRDKKDNVDWADVMTAIVNSVAADDDWFIPVEMMPEGMNETDYEDGYVFDHIPSIVKRTIATRTGKELLCAFTSPEKFSAGDLNEVMSIRYPARKLISELARWESVENP